MASSKETGERHPLEHDDSGDNPQFSVQEQSSTKPVPTEKSDEHLNHDPSLQTTQSPHKVKVHFNLHVQGHNVDEAQVIFSHHKEPVALTLGWQMGDSNLWQTTFDFDIDSLNQVSYHYRIFTKRNKLSDVPILGILFSKEPIDETESRIRYINSAQAQFDTFHSNSDLNYAHDTLPKSSIFYMQWFIDLVSHDTIKSILMQIEAMYFTCHPGLVSESVKYILERVADPSCTDFQRLYLSVVLGHLSKNNPKCVLFASDFTTKSNVDRLLQAFHSCAKLQLLPSSSLKILEEIAPQLVSASSNPGWLTLAAHFYSYLGASYVVEKMVLHKCDAKEYRALVSYLLPFLARECDDETQKLHRRLVVGVLEVAPNQEAVRDLYESPELEGYFTHSGIPKDDFFIEYYQNPSASSSIRQLSGKSVSQGEKLLYLAKMPTKLRTCNKMVLTVRNTLLEFVNHAEEPKKEHLEAFGKLIVCLPFEYVKVVLAALCNSESPPIHNLLLTIIDDPNFEAKWWKLSLVEKVNIFFEWIASKLHEKHVDGRNDMQLTTDAYECVNQLMDHANIGNNRILVERVCESVENNILRELDVITILQTYIRIESYDEVIQNCYTTFVKNRLDRRPRILRKAITQLNNAAKLNRCQRNLAISSHSKVSVSTGPIFSRLGQELLLCMLELMKIPASGGNDEEDDYKEMLDWSDVWTILLSTKGVDKIRKNSNFLAGKKKWQAFASRIKYGEVSAELLGDIKKHEENLSFMCAAVNLGFTNQSEFLKVKEMYQESISRLLKEQKECDKKLELLRSLITCGKNVSEDTCTVDGINDLIQEINKREKSWRTQKLSQLKDEGFWGPLNLLLGPAKVLKPLMKSVSFMNVAKICLKESQGPPTLDKEPKARDFYWLATFLATKATEQFLIKWHSILDYPGSLTTETMKPLLGTLKIQQLEEELSLVKAYFPTVSTSHVKDYISGYVNFPNVLKKAKRIITLLDTFGLLNSTESISSTLTSFISSYEDSYDLSLNALKKSMLAVDEIVSSFVGEETESIVEELGKSKELVSFLREIVDEDIRFLIDAVEEYSDQHVSESLVSYLIDVHGFLAPLIKIVEQSCDAQQFFATLKNSCAVYEEGMAVKLNQCSTNVNSLKGLYTSVANRGEITKEIIANGLKKGVYSVELRDDWLPEVQMSYQRDNSLAATYALSELHDLRSRAHLIANSEKNASKVLFGENEEINFSDFIAQVNLLTEIINLLSKLQSSGYVKYRKFWKQMRGTKTLQDTKNELQHDLEMWEGILSNAREQYYFLNYYRSDQLCILQDFLTNCSQVSCEDVLSLIHFVDPTIKKEQLEEYQKVSPTSKQGNSSNNPTAMVSIIGNALDEILVHTSPVIRPIQSNQEQSSFRPSTFDANVKPGELFLASLEAKSPLTANVLLTLYEATSNAFPEPYQVVFCSPQTTWEEIFLLLQRCFAQSQHLKHDSLFCIANVELLTNEVQFRLVNAIKEKQNISRGPGSLKENGNYRLALICCGGDHHHVAEQFAQYSHHVAGMSDCALSERLKSGWPEVRMVTSTLPGLGKTERIKSEVVDKDMNVITFSISGPLDQSKLVWRLKKLDLKKYHCLHLDIGEVDDPLWLDTFLFQLIVTGMVSSGTQLYHLLTAHVYIEIANTLNDWLRESLVISKSFTRVHLKWQNYEDLLVSSEITSNVQVVCQYFDAFDRARLESDDIHFTGPKKVQPLPATRCQELLANHYSSEEDTTFTALNIFLAVLADQLVKLSNSAFFKIATLKSMLGDDGAHGVRTNLFQALLEVSKEFASRSITSCRSSEISALSEKEAAEALDKAVLSSAMSAQHMVKRVEGMIQWEDSNHLLVVFHAANSQAIAAVYRDKTLVQPNVEELLKSQVVKGKKKELEDFKLMSQDQLQKKLEKIACTKPVKQSGGNLYSSYVLTPDNILKMILIILRVRANAPVIIMGETGCGKTSLVRYLANTCQIEFCTFNFHAGITEEEIVEFIGEKECQALKSGEQIWVFLDEINTCDHLGLISDVMCHHTLLGRPLPKNLVFLAACNPYKLRPKQHIATAGLEGKNVKDEYSGLVYRVHQLPEAMIDYVWDYGSLAPDDEKAYIRRMVLRNLPKNYRPVLVDLLAESQNFIREAEKNPFCVSLRDVYRCILLIQWFMDMIKKRGKVMSGNDYPDSKHLERYRLIWAKYDKKPEVKSIVLALAHCYLSRLPTSELRNSYQKHMTTLFSGNGTMMTSSKDEVNAFSAIVRMEEEDYLERMELPQGTAKNAALRENVFVMLVCILNRIPVFVVGMPGCSKSLSIQLIRSNLRGRDSNDPLFRQLPQLYVVSYQGSESSTSEGIIKVFEKAQKYKSHDKDGNVLPVVLLDEVGLAENSKYNPLKVLHSLLEPGDGQLPDVAVVGISNWSLDAAKMNRAIHLSRPEPTKHDLYETGYSLHYADSEGTGQYNLSSQELQCLADGYFEYQTKQKHDNFHGLRDYYSLIKSLSRSSDVLQVNMALQRNFGGIPGELDKIQKIFLDKLEEYTLSSGEDIIPVTELIQGNLTDAWARHLMLITSGDSAIGILKQNLSKLEKEIITIFGSRFEEDLSEEYNYRILSRIILCMERDCVLILRDLESIYGSLYDMLNQNYSLVGKRKNCRIALGAYSNPMCHVNDGFRCIVLTDHDKVDFTDPPFLNRFEKQMLRFSDVLEKKQQEVIAELHRWVQQLSTIQGLESHFKESDMFIGFHEDTLPSLVLSHSHDTEESPDEIISKCKDDLMWVASPDGVLRAQKSDGFKEDSQEIKKLSNEYFKKPIHQGLASFMETVTGDQECSKTDEEIGSKTIVMTFSNIHTDIQKCMNDTAIKCQTERLSAYKSEKQLAERINHFWTTPDHDLLVLQCKPKLDNAHMLLARSIIEEKRSSYKQDCQDVEVKRRKHVCIVVHIQRGTLSNSVSWQFSFLCGWKQVFLDVLEASPVSLDAIRNESIHKLLTSSIWPLRRIAQNDLPWCFTRIKYTRQQRPLDSILCIAQNLFRSEKVCQAIEHLVLQWVKKHGDKRDEDAVSNEGWQVKVACDKQALINSSTLYCAMEQFVSRLVREPLAKIIYFLEKENAWPSHVFDRSEENALVSDFEDMWCRLILKKGIFDMSEIPEPLGAESYVLDSISLDLQVPFSQVVIKRIDAAKDLFLEDYAQVLENEDNLDEAGHLGSNTQQEQLMRYSEIITNLVPEIQEFPASCREFYMADLFDLTTADFSAKLSRHQRLSTVKAAFVSQIKRSLQVKDTLRFFVQLHTFLWIHKEQIVDQLRMVDCCRSFVNPEVLTIVTKDFLSSQNELTYTNSDDEEKHVKITDGDSEDESKEFLEPKPRDEPTELHSGNEDEGPENESNALQEQKLPAEGDRSQSKGGYDSEDESKEFLEPKPRDDEPTELYSGNEDEGTKNESNALQEQKLSAVDNRSQSKGGYDSEDESKEFLEPKPRDNKPIELYSENENENPENEINNALQEQKLPAEDDHAQSKSEYDSGDDATDSQNTEQQDYADQTNDTIFDDIERENQEMVAERSETNVEEETNKSCEDEKLGVEQEGFEDILVKVYCEEMLPSPETVEKRNGSLESWIRNTCLLLSLALKISDQTPAFHFLRLCVDFAKIVLASSDSQKLPLYPLYIINEIGNNLNPWYLDAENSFQEITEKLIRPLEDQVKDDAVKHEAMQKFSALFYARCIDSNVDTCGAPKIVEDVLSLDRADLVLMMGPVILRLLMVEEMALPGVFVKLITNPRVIEECPCLQNIDEVFKDLFSDGSIHHDSYAAVMICDLIQSLLRFDDCYSIDDIDSSDCELLRCVSAAVAVLSDDEQDSCGLVLLSAVAFLRAFLTMFSRFIVEEANILKADSQYSRVITEVNSLLTVVDERTLSLQLFFVKQLHQNMSLFGLRKLCRESEILPTIKGIWDDDKSVDKAEFVSVCKLPEYRKVKAAYWKLTSEDETDMLAFLEQCQNSSNHCLALLGILVNMIYLNRAVRKLTNKEEQMVDWFLQKVKLFPLPLRELLLRIMGRKDFHCPQLQLSPESTVDEVETALLILHITCIIASGVQSEVSPVYQYFSNPARKSKQAGYLLAHGKERMYRLFDKRESINGPSSFTCTCGLRIMFKNDHEDNGCPHCNSRVDPKTEKTPPSSSKSSSPLPVKEPECQWDVSMNGMNPSVYRALHLIVYSSFYAGVAVKVSSKEDLSPLLNYLENDPHLTSTTNTECQDPANFCFDQVTSDLSCLMTILSCKKEVAIKVMNLVVEKCTELIRGKTLDKNTCSTRKQLLEWEEEFSNLTKDVLLEALGSTKVLKEVMRIQQTEENRESYILKNQIQELDEYPVEPKKQNLHLKRLFRVTRQPTFEEFRAIFVNSSKHFQRKHSFLSLFFARFHELPNLGNLYHLLKWSRVVSSELTHRVSRKEAQSKSCTIDDFISGHLLGQDRSKDQRKSYKKLFDNFKEAWNEMRHLVNQQRKTGNKMPRLKDADNIAYCLMESDSGDYLFTAIRILVSLQNSILDEMLLLSTLHQHPALSFLAKDNNCSGIPSVTLQEAKEKEIINFKWSDELFAKYAQNNPVYGNGEEVSYDFEGMELKLASRLAFGKCYLTGSLNKFIFSKELFHSCGPLLTELRELLTQSPILPDDVRLGLSRLKERRIKEAPDLLQHIEVLIFVLKLKLKNFDEEITLETFAAEWLSMLPSPFPVSLLPQPSSSIKLKHIAALYEALEDILADGAIDGLPDRFWQDLSSEMKRELEDLVDKDSPLELHALLNALRRFVFRYLSAEKFLPTGNPTLRSSLQEPSLWSPATPPDLLIIPNEMTLEHVHSIITYLQDIEKERKGHAKKQNEKRPQRRTPPVVVSSQGGRSRRRVKCKD